MFLKLARWAQGRHTLFAVYFAVMGTILQWFHRLDTNYIMLIGAIQAFILGHSIKEDYFLNKTQPQVVPPSVEDPGKEPSK